MDSSACLYKATRWFNRWRCGFKAEWQGGSRTRSILDLGVSFSFSPTNLRRGLARRPSIEDSRCFPYIVQMNSSNCFSPRYTRFHSSPSCRNALWNLGWFSRFFNGPTFPIPFEGTGAVFSNEYIHPKKRRTVVFCKGYCELREVNKLSIFPWPDILVYSQLVW